MSDSGELLSRAKEVLTHNDQGLFTIPSHGLYPHQWLWDSCFIAIGQRHYDVERAKMEILGLLRGQWSNGMVPHIIVTPGHKERRHHGIWHSWVSPYAPDGVSTSGITQPPMLAEAVVRVGKKLPLVERRSWYRQVWPALLAYHTWLYTERDPHGEGLTLQIHPWETGLDTITPWMSELNSHLLPWWIRLLEKLRLVTLLNFLRTDTRFVPHRQRPTNVEAMAMYDAQLRLRRKQYNIVRILDHSLFAIEDLAFNSIFVRANEHLRAIAKTIRAEIPAELLKRMDLTVKTFDELWDPYTEMYYPRDFITHRLIKEPSIESLLPLYAGCISKERAAILVKMLENEHLFGPAYPVPTAPLNSLWFDPVRYWQGPTWFNTNWLIIDGLKRYGYHDHAAALTESMLELVKEHGFYEYFNPLDGTPLGAPNFSWTAALTIDLLEKQT
ncbi:MAG TPA: trehalase family glycosidase [Candidatus Saccharimonadales bacterium]|nr:trehalase family glycosidase [Candidatus Saccharimonadales bacterium]